jgi:hypothetical protein
MGFRTAELRRFRFDRELGNRGATPLGGEEVAVMERILEAGGSGWWIPDARVEHLIPPERLTADYLWTYFTSRGRRLHLDRKVQRADRFGRIGWIVQAMVGAASYAIGKLLRNPELWVVGLRRQAIAKGYLEGSDAALKRAPNLTFTE